MSEFRSFATLLRTAPPAPVVAPDPPPLAAAPAVTVPPQPAPPPPIDPQVTQVIKGFAAELRRLRARALEIFEAECEVTLAALAGDVLARELALAPADVATIVERAKARLGPQTLRVRLSPHDAGVLADPHFESDSSLEPGDVVFETEHGTLDMRLGARVRAVLGARSVKV